MGALDIKQAGHDCSTCADRTKPNVYGNCVGCDAPDRPHWSPAPTPPTYIPYGTVEPPYGIHPTPAAVRHIYISTLCDRALAGRFCAAEHPGNVPLIPTLMYINYFDRWDSEHDRQTVRLASLDVLRNLANELLVVGDMLDDDMRAEIEEALRLELPVRFVSDADIAAWDKRRREAPNGSST